MGAVIAPHNHCLHPGKAFGISAYVQDMACFVGQMEVFDEASETLHGVGGISLSDKQIERICHKYGQALEEQPPGLETDIEPKEGWHYAMADGAMVLTRQKDKEGQSKWAEMKLGRVFKAAHHVAMGSGAESRKWIRGSQYVAHLGNCDEFFDKFMGHLDSIKYLIFIADGAKWIWERVHAFYPNAVQILDFFHVMEHLWAFLNLCWKLNFETEGQRNEWAQTQKQLLLEGLVSQVCEHIAALKVATKEQSGKQSGLLQYYENNKGRMDYGAYLENGWLIGSGPIESAHREVIQKRLKRSGQRWTLPGAQQVANLRVAYKSKKWGDVQNLIKIRA